MATSSSYQAPCAQPPSRLFKNSTKLPDVVIALKQTPPLVHNLRAEYDALTGCLTVDRETLASLERITRTAVRDDASLLSPVESLGERARAEYERGYQAGL